MEKQTEFANYAVYGACWPFQLDPVSPWAYWDKAFTREECEAIIRLGNSNSLQPATVQNMDVTDIRESHVAWIFPNEHTGWIFEKMSNIVTDLNNRFFKFDIFGAVEGFQFTRYVAPGGRYGRHVDNSYNTTVRKLSFTLQLSDPREYEGGELCLYYGKDPEIMKKEQGYVALFPSYTLHEVTPVTRGTRYSLVSWITGAPFK